MAAAKDDVSRRLIASILQFLESENLREDMDDEIKQSVDVSRQCLQSAYTITSADVPADQKTLKELFLAACPAPVVEVKELTEEDKQQAENFKLEGNGHMKNGDYNAAIASYNKAIAIDPKTAVYYCNRAAAQTGREAYDMALTDCQKALEIDSQYSKAYSRMGLTYSKMEIFDEAVKCYEKALEIDPENEGYKKNLGLAKEKLEAMNKPPQMPGFPGMGGLGGMGGGFNEFLQNPAFLDMAKQVMENPAMKQMAMSMMGNMMGGGAPGLDPSAGASNGGGAPSMDTFLNMGQRMAEQMSASNPELVEQLRQQMGVAGESSEPSSEAPKENGDETTK